MDVSNITLYYNSKYSSKKKSFQNIVIINELMQIRTW